MENYLYFCVLGKTKEKSYYCMIIDKIKEHIAKIEDFSAKTKEELEQFRIQYLVKKGCSTTFLPLLKKCLRRRKNFWAGSE